MTGKWQAMLRHTKGISQPSQGTSLLGGILPIFNSKEPAIYEMEYTLGGQFCQACGH
jgi:hypothetical protein